MTKIAVVKINGKDVLFLCIGRKLTIDQGEEIRALIESRLTERRIDCTCFVITVDEVQIVGEESKGWGSKLFALGFKLGRIFKP